MNLTISTVRRVVRPGGNTGWGPFMSAPTNLTLGGFSEVRNGTTAVPLRTGTNGNPVQSRLYRFDIKP